MIGRLWLLACGQVRRLRDELQTDGFLNLCAARRSVRCGKMDRGME